MKTAQQLALELMSLAMDNTDRLHIHVSYAAHVNHIDVRVFKSDNDYQAEPFISPIINKTIYLDWPHYNPAEELQRVIDDVKTMLAEMAK